jgi:excisionase family DNA binding protein
MQDNTRLTVDEPSAPLGRTIRSTCHLIGISRSKVYDLLHDGTLKSVKIGRRRLVLDNSIRDLMRAA